MATPKVNIVGFEAIFWSFLWTKNARDCNVTILLNDVTMVLSWHHMFIHNGTKMSVKIEPVLYTEIIKFICIQ